jgi:hypothetical protein
LRVIEPESAAKPVDMSCTSGPRLAHENKKPTENVG